MRKILLMLCMGMAALSAWASPVRGQQDEPCGTLVFDSIEADMGLIEKDSAAVAVFHFRVTGSAPVIIQRAATACNCTTVTYPRVPLKPGDEGEISVRYNSRGLPSGFFRKVVVVRANATVPLMRLSVSGHVRRERFIHEVQGM